MSLLALFIQIGLTFVVLAPAIVVHEYAHGWMANRCGDPTAKHLGRLTLNPIKHIDFIGSIIVPGLLFLAYYLGYTQSLLLFGWAKPVPVNFGRLNNPKRDMILVAVAGPIVNIILALVLAAILSFTSGFLSSMIGWAIILNLVLAVFNMIPIPPLDGSRVVMGLLPDDLAKPYARIEPYGLIIIIILLNIGLLDMIWPIVRLLASQLGAHL